MYCVCECYKGGIVVMDMIWSCCFCFVLKHLGLVLRLVVLWSSVVCVFSYICVGELFVECVC